MFKHRFLSAAAIVVCAFVGPAVLAVPTNGLVGHWDADGDATDQSGNGLDGTVVGNVTYGPGKSGQAFDIPWGGVDYVDLPEITLSGPFSITAWWSITSSGRHAIVGWGTGAGNGHKYIQVRDTDRYKYKFGLRQINGLIDDYTDVTIRLRNKGLFSSGRAQVAEDFKPLLKRIADAISIVERNVVVAGHSDNVPIHTIRFPSNWHLSMARAEAVTELILQESSASSEITAEGRADNEPLAPNDTPANRAMNRRVEIILEK